MSGGPILVGVDVGTSRVRALAFDAAGALIAEEGVPTPASAPRPGWAEHDPEALWRAVCAALRGVLSRLDDAGAVVSVAVASMGETGVPIDARGRPLHAAIAWHDVRTEAEVAELERLIGREKLGETTGLCLDPTFGLCKLLWLRRNAPDAYASMTAWLNVADWIAFRLSGVMATDYSLASRMLALDLGRRDWAADVLDRVGVSPSLFAPLTPSGTPLGPATAQACAETGLPSTAVIAVGGHDHICGALAAGVTRPGLVLDSLGTAEAVFMTLERPILDPAATAQGYHQGAIRAAPDLDVSYILGAIPTSGGSVEWFRKTCAFGMDYESLIAEAEASPAGAGGVCFLPHLRLSCSPHPDALARGAFIGLTTDASRGGLFRAVLEGLALEARLALDGMVLLPGVAAPSEIRVIGGGGRNDLFLRIKASAYGRPLLRMAMTETTGLGAALLGGVGAGIYSGMESAAAAVRREGTQTTPDPASQAIYDRLYEDVYRDIYGALRPLNHKLHY